MKKLMQNLIHLQALQFGETKEKNSESVIAGLRAKVPAQILGHYDRLVVRGKKGVATVRNQVCTGCHMRLPIGVVAKLMHGDDIQLCDTCGRYLYLEETAAPAPASAPTEPMKPAVRAVKPAVPKTRSRKKSAVHA